MSDNKIFSQRDGIIVTKKIICNDGFERSHVEVSVVVKSKSQCDSV